MNSTLFSLVASLAVTSAALAAHESGHTKSLTLNDKDGAAILDSNPAASFTHGKPAKGNPRFKSTYDGVNYHFASAEHHRLSPSRDGEANAEQTPFLH